MLRLISDPAFRVVRPAPGSPCAGRSMFATLSLYLRPSCRCLSAVSADWLCPSEPVSVVRVPTLVTVIRHCPWSQSVARPRALRSSLLVRPTPVSASCAVARMSRGPSLVVLQGSPRFALALSGHPGPLLVCAPFGSVHHRLLLLSGSGSQSLSGRPSRSSRAAGASPPAVRGGDASIIQHVAGSCKMCAQPWVQGGGAARRRRVSAMEPARRGRGVQPWDQAAPVQLSVVCAWLPALIYRCWRALHGGRPPAPRHCHEGLGGTPPAFGASRVVMGVPVFPNDEEGVWKGEHTPEHKVSAVSRLRPEHR
jgi:hypothetical protein